MVLASPAYSSVLPFCSSSFFSFSRTVGPQQNALLLPNELKSAESPGSSPYGVNHDRPNQSPGTLHDASSHFAHIIWVACRIIVSSDRTKCPPSVLLHFESVLYNIKSAPRPKHIVVSSQIDDDACLLSALLSVHPVAYCGQTFVRLIQLTGLNVTLLKGIPSGRFQYARNTSFAA